MGVNPFLPYSGGPFIEAALAMRAMGVHGKQQRAVLDELGVTVIRIAGTEFIAERELNEALARARVRVVAQQQEAAK